MLDDFLELFRDYRQDSQIRQLQRRLESISAFRNRAAPERNMAAAAIRLLIKKGLITPDELADEMEAIDQEQFGRIRPNFDVESADATGGVVDSEKIAEIDSSVAKSDSANKPKN
jgi:hypothetical protein